RPRQKERGREARIGPHAQAHPAARTRRARARLLPLLEAAAHLRRDEARAAAAAGRGGRAARGEAAARAANRDGRLRRLARARGAPARPRQARRAALHREGHPAMAREALSWRLDELAHAGPETSTRRTSPAT